MKALLLRAPLAMVLASMVFVVGFVRLVALTTQVSTHVMRGERPGRALSRLQHERAVRTFAQSKSSRVN
jgi:hypothetical protein